MMATTTADVEDAVHLHWCPRCDTTWACGHAFDACPLQGSVVVADHCDRLDPCDLD
jgi:hypothetical protein